MLSVRDEFPEEPFSVVICGMSSAAYMRDDYVMWCR